MRAPGPVRAPRRGSSQSTKAAVLAAVPVWAMPVTLRRRPEDVGDGSIWIGVGVV